MSGSSSHVCSYEWPTDCRHVDPDIAASNRHTSCIREPLPDTDRCIWHAGFDETAYKTTQAIRDACVISDEDATLSLPEKELIGAELTGLDIEECIIAPTVSLRGVCLAGARLPDVVFGAADLTAADLSDAEFQSAIFQAATLCEATIKRTELNAAKLTDADLTNANLSNAELAEADFGGATLTGAKLLKANLRNAELADANLTEANLKGADLSEACLEEATLTGANLRGADLSNADLSGVDFSDAELHGATLAGADLDDISLTNAQIVNADLSEVNLENENLSNAYLSGTDLTGAKLETANLSEAILEEVDLTDATLTGATLEGAYLPDADLTGADLTNADLTGANLEGAVLTNVDLSYATLDHARFLNVTLQNTKVNTETTIKFPLRPEKRAEDGIASIDGEPGPVWLRILATEVRPLQETAIEDSRREAARLLEEAEQGYRLLRELRNENALSYDPRFAIQEKHARRKRALVERDYWQWVKAAISRWVLGYGERVRPVIGTMGAVILLCAVLYPVFGFNSGGRSVAYRPPWIAWETVTTLLQGLYFSTTTFSTLGYGNAFPTGLARVVATVESFAGALLIAYLVFVLGRRTVR